LRKVVKLFAFLTCCILLRFTFLQMYHQNYQPTYIPTPHWHCQPNIFFHQGFQPTYMQPTYYPMSTEDQQFKDPISSSVNEKLFEKFKKLDESEILNNFKELRNSHQSSKNMNMNMKKLLRVITPEYIKAGCRLMNTCLKQDRHFRVCIDLHEKHNQDAIGILYVALFVSMLESSKENLNFQLKIFTGKGHNSVSTPVILDTVQTKLYRLEVCYKEYSDGEFLVSVHH